jgi:hypothetical protein
MKNYIKILIGVLIVAVTGFFWFWKTARTVEGVTDRNNYNLGDALAISIKNNLGQTVCFSSCYPYLLEKQNVGGGWDQYLYESCSQKDIAADCISADGVKKFRLSLAEADAGMNRLKLQVCVNCAPGREFKANSALYSNVFEVK